MKQLPTTMAELRAMKGQPGGGDSDLTGPWRRPSFADSEPGTDLSEFSGNGSRGVDRV